jgi:hypothetical protein
MNEKMRIYNNFFHCGVETEWKIILTPIDLLIDKAECSFVVVTCSLNISQLFFGWIPILELKS